MEQKQMKLNIELGDKEAEGIYANFAIIGFSPSEMIFDFARIMPGKNKGKCKYKELAQNGERKLKTIVPKDNHNKKKCPKDGFPIAYTYTNTEPVTQADKTEPCKNYRYPAAGNSKGQPNHDDRRYDHQ